MKRLHYTVLKISNTRKSSYVNARRISTAAYQVLHLFPEVGYPPPGQVQLGVPTEGYPRWGTPWAGGTPHQGVPSPGQV